jgi:hypothetical protein
MLYTEPSRTGGGRGVGVTVPTPTPQQHAVILTLNEGKWKDLQFPPNTVILTLNEGKWKDLQFPPTSTTRSSVPLPWLNSAGNSASSATSTCSPSWQHTSNG